MRITGGQARGIPLSAPAGDRTRPATDQLRQALFSSIAERVPQARFADLFAGSGSYGLEAFSRGASGGVFVEKAPAALACASRNLAAVAKSCGRSADALQLRRADVFGAWCEREEPFDLIFCDPPYARLGEWNGRIEALGRRLVKPGGLFVLECPGGFQVSWPGWTQLRRLGAGGDGPTAALLSPPAAPGLGQQTGSRPQQG